MRFQLTELQNLTEIVDDVDIIYIYDDVKNFRFAENLEEAEENTIPENIIISEEDVRNLINDIQNCRRIFIQPRPNNASFLAQYDLNEEDCRDIINQITVKDYVKNTVSRNSTHRGNNLVVFEIEEVKIRDITIPKLTVYVKIDLDESTETTVVAISFHPARYIDEKLYV